MFWERMTKHKNAGGMGFRHFQDFNIAMLGKQLWRLANNPNSLVSRLYKAKYYDSSDIFRAKLDHNPSFIWRGLLEELNNYLRKGLVGELVMLQQFKFLSNPGC